MEIALTNLRYHQRLRGVTLPPSITPSHLLHAETSRLEEYAEVARIYRRYRATVALSAWDAVTDIGKRVLPLPGHVGPDSTEWIQFGAAVLRS